MLHNGNLDICKASRKGRRRESYCKLCDARATKESLVAAMTSLLEKFDGDDDGCSIGRGDTN